MCACLSIYVECFAVYHFEFKVINTKVLTVKDIVYQSCVYCRQGLTFLQESSRVGMLLGIRKNARTCQEMGRLASTSQNPVQGGLGRTLRILCSSNGKVRNRHVCSIFESTVPRSSVLYQRWLGTGVILIFPRPELDIVTGFPMGLTIDRGSPPSILLCPE